MSDSDKMNYQFSQFQAAARQINRHSDVMMSNRQSNIAQQLKIDKFKEVVQKKQAEIEHLRAENVQLRAADNARGIEMNCMKEQSILLL
ncbi:hypothetical protein Hanom_Chr03g00185471 [Helianthus anomalus]